MYLKYSLQTKEGGVMLKLNNNGFWMVRANEGQKTTIPPYFLLF